MPSAFRRTRRTAPPSASAAIRPSLGARGGTDELPHAVYLGTRWNAVYDGFRVPDEVMKPDCHPAARGSSRRRNQSIMSILGCLRAIENACVRYLAWFA